jgi:hypothetical protein
MAVTYGGGMTRPAAHKLARLLRAQGYAVTVKRHAHSHVTAMLSRAI